MTKALSRTQRFALLATAVLLGAQFLRPSPPGQQLEGSGPIEAHVAVPRQIAELLRATCYDCHSEATEWPWYARITPISWIVAADVREGRSGLDFSHWSTDPVREPTEQQRLRGICYDIREGLMPPRAYVAMHPAARLSQAARDDICRWAEAAVAGLRP